MRLSGAGTPQFPLSVSRLSQSSLTNLANVTSSLHNNHHSNSNNINNNINAGLKRTDSARKSNVDPTEHQTFLENGSEESYQTPSPADSAVGDLEQVLREKEGEIVYLRDTLEQNEQVIFRVYEEKEKTWEREIRKIKVKAFHCSTAFYINSSSSRTLIFTNLNISKMFLLQHLILKIVQGLYETQLKTHQMKASKMEAALANQTYQVLLSLAYQMLVLLTLVNKLDADGGNPGC